MRKPSRERVDAILAQGIDLPVVKSRLERHWSNGKRPKFWDDDAAFAAAILLYRKANIADAADIINERFGPETTSKSAIARFWKHVLSKAVMDGLAV